MTTLENSIKAGYLVTFPHITVKQLRQFPPNFTATVKGHMHVIKEKKQDKTSYPVAEKQTYCGKYLTTSY